MTATPTVRGARANGPATPDDDDEPEGPAAVIPPMPGWNAPEPWTRRLEEGTRRREADLNTTIAGLSIGPRYAELLAEQASVTRSLRELRRRNDEAPARLNRARDMDLAAAAAARRRGEPDPGDVSRKAEDDAIAHDQREVQILVRQRAAIDAEISGMATPDVATEAIARLQADQHAAAQRLAEYAAIRWRIAALGSVVRWARSNGAEPLKAAVPIVPMQGDPSFLAVVSALEQLDEVAGPWWEKAARDREAAAERATEAERSLRIREGTR